MMLLMLGVVVSLCGTEGSGHARGEMVTTMVLLRFLLLLMIELLLLLLLLWMDLMRVLLVWMTMRMVATTLHHQEARGIQSRKRAL